MAFFPLLPQEQPKITFQQAADFVMPYGEHKGERLDDIAITDKGLLYLDWAYDEFDIGTDVYRHIEAYVTDKHIAKEIQDLIS